MFVDKKILGLSFGSKLGGIVRHCHPLNDNPRKSLLSRCRGAAGELQGDPEQWYQHNTMLPVLMTPWPVLLGEPTCYSEVLQYAARDAARAGAEVEYTVILIITDGGVSDMEVSIVYTSIIHTV